MPTKPTGKSRHLDEAFRAELKALRSAKNWTQEDLAERSGYTQAFLSRVETGSQTPGLTAVFDLCEALGISPDAFMSAVVQRTKTKPNPRKSTK